MSLLSIYIIVKYSVASCRKWGLGAGDWGLENRELTAESRKPAAGSRKPGANSQQLVGERLTHYSSILPFITQSNDWNP